MPPRKRAVKDGGSPKDSSEGNNSPATASGGETQEPSAHAQDGAERMHFQPSKYPKRKGGVKWFPVLKRLFYVSLLVLVPMILNYAVLNHESRVLIPQGVS